MTLTLGPRFWSKVDRTASCWNWTGAIAKGYGRFRHEGNNRLAYRVAYAALIGPIPEGMQLDHLCRNRACVNPQHLEPVSPAENTRRSPLLGRGSLRKTHCPKGHGYTDENTYRHPVRQDRQCRACAAERARDRRAAA